MFELSFVGVRQKLIEIWLFANEFKNKILANFEVQAVSNLLTNCS